MILRKSSLSWSCQAKTQDSVSSTCEHDIFQPYNVCLCNRNITAFKVISIVLSCLTIYLLLGTYIYYFTMTKYVVQLVYLLILAIITWHWNGAYMLDPGDSSRANQEHNSSERLLRGKTPL